MFMAGDLGAQIVNRNLHHSRYIGDFNPGDVIEHGAVQITRDRNRAYIERFGDGLLLGGNNAFGLSVHGVSYNAVANLEYANLRFVRPVHEGDLLWVESRVLSKTFAKD